MMGKEVLSVSSDISRINDGARLLDFLLKPLRFMVQHEFPLRKHSMQLTSIMNLSLWSR